MDTKKVWLEPFPLFRIWEYKIVKELDCHDTAIIKGSIDEIGLMQYKMMFDSSMCISLRMEKDKEKELLFSGFPDSIEISEIGECREVIFHLSGVTKTMDLARKMRDFQSESKMKKTIIADTTKNYSNLVVDDISKDHVISEFLMQYEETDYEFLRRILRRDHECIYTCSKGGINQVILGKEPAGDSKKMQVSSYDIYQNKKLYYRVKSEEILHLGQKISFNGKTLFVNGLKYVLENGEYSQSYKLCKDIENTEKFMGNEEVIGVSLDGIIKDRKRDKVKINLNASAGTAEGEERWFGYASPASSSDGSGWYCMPEVGEEIRLFCPTYDEKDAYVISAIRSTRGDSSGGADAGGDGGGGMEPSNKSLSNDQGQSVQFTPDGVMLSCSGGSAVMNLMNTGEIIIDAQSDIEFLSDESIEMRAETGVVVTASSTVSLTNETGSSMTIGSGIELAANRIKNNC